MQDSQAGHDTSRSLMYIIAAAGANRVFIVRTLLLNKFECGTTRTTSSTVRYVVHKVKKTYNINRESGLACRPLVLLSTKWLISIQ